MKADGVATAAASELATRKPPRLPLVRDCSAAAAAAATAKGGLGVGRGAQHRNRSHELRGRGTCRVRSGPLLSRAGRRPLGGSLAVDNVRETESRPSV